MEDKYKKFKEFDWVKSSEWQNYYSNLFPTPPGTKTELYKKKFYKLKIDPDFDINYTPPATDNTTTTNNSNNYTTSNFQTGYSPPNPTRQQSTAIQGVEAMVWLFFLQSLLFQFHTLKLAAVALLIHTFNRVGMPKFNIEFAQLLFLDEHFQLLLYALLFMIERFNYFVLIPLILTAILNLSYYVNTNHSKLPSIVTNIIKPYTDKVVAKRVELAKIRANIEIAIGGLLIIGIFVGINGFLTPVFYWQYMRFKYIVNEDTKYAFGRLNTFVNSKKSSLPGPVNMIVGKLQQFAEYMGRTEAAPGQAAGGANCVIF